MYTCSLTRNSFYSPLNEFEAYYRSFLCILHDTVRERKKKEQQLFANVCMLPSTGAIREDISYQFLPHVD